MLLSDIRELKAQLEIDSGDTSEDKKLNFFVEIASSWIEELLNRPGLSYKSRTEFYNGTGTQRLLLRSRPVYTTPTIQVSVDESGYFGQPSGSFDTNTALTYGDDFYLQTDQEDGTSRCGILIRNGTYWPKPRVRQAGLLAPFLGIGFGVVKVVYSAGYFVDNLPPAIRFACNLLVAKMRHLMPLGLELTSESYEERSMSWVGERKDYLLALVKPMIHPYRNRNF